ncbi:RNA polymerase sigma factor [Rosistilla oblonga]|uniref:RNA polymerase sigma factor n=1 Tax=Rosistilla oblonga TaxID=2527990 RepID=UPI003A97B1BD
MNYECLARTLSLLVRTWRLPPGTTADDVVTDSMSCLWERETSGEKVIQPSRWLARTAKLKCRELARNKFHTVSTSAVADKPYASSSCAHASSAVTTLESTTTWTALPAKQRFVIIECIMFDRPVAEVAEQIKVKRSTVKSWIARIPPRLAKEHSLQLLVRNATAPTSPLGRHR